MNPDELATHLIRPSKRRKFYRKRSDTADCETATASLPAQSASPTSIVSEKLLSEQALLIPPPVHLNDETSSSVAEILRQRKAVQRRKCGVEFTSSVFASASVPQTSTAMGVQEDDGIPADIKSVISRFAPQTGQVSEETDKHMMAYIDSELAQRSQKELSTHPSSLHQTLSPNDALIAPATGHRQPAAVGKLHEIDLGPDAKARNIARTEAAILGDVKDEPLPPRKPPKPRIGRNGKPYIPRPRKGRNSLDVARDKLVEEVLRESRLEVYDEPEAASEADTGDQAADDRIAEEFRKEFLDAQSQRRQKKPRTAAKVGGKVVDDKPRGPKLGGSRSARAAMREKEEAAAKAAAAKGRR